MILKVGFSNNTHQRVKSHETSVGKFTFNWVFFIEQTKDVEKAIKKRFLFPEGRLNNNREHFTVSSEELRQFVISYCKLMDYGYKKLCETQLKLYGNSAS